jgi:hypothetical protein
MYSVLQSTRGHWQANDSAAYQHITGVYLNSLPLLCSPSHPPLTVLQLTWEHQHVTNAATKRSSLLAATKCSSLLAAADAAAQARLHHDVLCC